MLGSSLVPVKGEQTPGVRRGESGVHSAPQMMLAESSPGTSLHALDGKGLNGRYPCP